MKCIKCNNEIGMNRTGLSFSGWTGKLGDGSGEMCNTCFQQIKPLLGSLKGTFVGLTKMSKQDLKNLGVPLHEDLVKGAKVMRDSVINLLNEKGKSLTVSDIDSYLKIFNTDITKTVCKSLYSSGEIGFAGNGRYFSLTSKNQQSNKETNANSEAVNVDIEEELEKLKGLLDKELITQDDYDAKKKELLGL
jgi:hypothetical protein